MSANTKIVVLRSREVLYTILLLFVGILIILVLLSLFLPSDSASPTEESAALYVPGVYSSTLQLGNAAAQLQVTVDTDHINAIELINLDEAVTTMYPLMEPCLDELTAKVIDNQGLENISYSTESRYTSILLLNAISQSLSAHASDGILRSPLGDSATLPTLGPSGRQERLNCCAKNLR